MRAFLAVKLLLGVVLIAGPASACFIGCRPSDDDARAVVGHLVASKFSSHYALLSYQTTRRADFDMIAGEIRGFEIFFRAQVQFPDGANLDCAPSAPKRANDCSSDAYYSLIRETRPVPGRQYIEPGKSIELKDETRFDESDGGWKGQDGVKY